MSLAILPRELRQCIVNMVGEQDSGYKERVLLKYGDKKDRDDYRGRGVRALSLVDKEMRSLALQLLFEPFRFSKVAYYDLDLLRPSDIVKRCRSAVVSSPDMQDMPELDGRDEWFATVREVREGQALFEVLNILDTMPCLKHIVIGRFSLRYLFRHLQNLVYPPPVCGLSASPRTPLEPDPVALASHIPFDALRIASYTFANAVAKQIEAILSISPLTTTSITITADPYPRRMTTRPAWNSYYTAAVAMRVAACTNLFKLDLRCSTAEAHAPLHPSFNAQTFSQPAPVTCLTLSFDSLQTGGFAFIASFAESLPFLSLDLAMGVFGPPAVFLETKLPHLQVFEPH